MEDDETFDAGRGSFLNMDGRVQLDACMMDGATLRAGGVGCVEHIRNPIRAAKKILTDSPHVYFVGTGAERFAQEHGLELCANDDLIIEREVERLREAKKQGYLADAGRVRSHALARHRGSGGARPATAISRPAPRPAARSTRLPGAWATRRSSAAAAMPTTSAPRSPPPDGASP